MLKVKKRSGFWNLQENRKAFLDEIAQKFNIKVFILFKKLKRKKPKDWGRIKYVDITENGGFRLLHKYRSLYNALQDNFPNITWKKEWFSNPRPKLFWINKKNARVFLENFAKLKNIKEPQDWASITLSDIAEHGGNPLIQKYKSSIFQTLVAVFPEVPWKKEWFTRMHEKPFGFWKERNNQREFVLEVAKKFNIKKPQEWKKVSRNAFIEAGGVSLVNRFGSLHRVLKTTFPEQEWKKEWFRSQHTRGFWEIKSNRKIFLEEFAKENGISEPKDWGKVTTRYLAINGGNFLLKLYQGSLFRVLQDVFPGIHWKKEWFPTIPIYSRSFWEEQNNQRKFLDNLAQHYHLVNPKDWLRVSLELIRKRGGQGLLSKYSNSLELALHSLYPRVNWGSISNKSKSEDRMIKWTNSTFNK